MTTDELDWVAMCRENGWACYAKKDDPTLALATPLDDFQKEMLRKWKTEKQRK